MSCCGKSRDSKFCPECGGKIPEVNLSTKIRDLLNKPFCEDVPMCKVFINKSDLNKTCCLNKKYDKIKYIESERTDEYFIIVSCPIVCNNSAKSIKGSKVIDVIKDNSFELKTNDGKSQICQTTENIILRDMKIPQFHPYFNATVEDAMIGFIKSGISDPLYLYEIVCDGKFSNYTTTMRCNYQCYKKNYFEKNYFEMWLNGIQSHYDSIFTTMASMTESKTYNLYMFNNKIYTSDELNNKYCTGNNVSIDWKQCAERIHLIKDIKIHILLDDVNILLKKLEDNIKIKKLLPAVRKTNDDNGEFNNIFFGV
jgi:hypothetical protein